MDDIPVSDIRRFEAELLDYVGRERPGIYATILTGGKLDDELVAQLQDALKAFKQQFTSTSDEHAVNEPASAPLDRATEGQESIKRHVPDDPDTDSQEA
jgi:F-type H+-transporting ATPase subunit alpha